MSELEMTTEAEVEDFTDELSDEALDRAEGALLPSYGCHPLPPPTLFHALSGLVPDAW